MGNGEATPVHGCPQVTCKCKGRLVVALEEGRCKGAREQESLLTLPSLMRPARDRLSLALVWVHCFRAHLDP
jgi:hypothetical protein